MAQNIFAIVWRTKGAMVGANLLTPIALTAGVWTLVIAMRERKRERGE